MSIVDADEEFMALDEQQYFFFMLGEDTYALKASAVTEMIEYQPYTVVPKMQSYIKGVTNVRGEIITVIDLKNRFNLGDTLITKKTALVIVKGIALMIDEVDEVGVVDNTQIKESLDFGFKIEQRFVKAMVFYRDEYIAVLDEDEILNLKEISKVVS